MINAIIDVIKKMNFSTSFIINDENGTEKNYADYLDESLKIASFLKKSTKYQTITAVMENSYELSQLYFSFMIMDKTLVVIDPQKGETEILNILSGLHGTIVISDNDEIISLCQANNIHTISLPPIEKRDLGKEQIKTLFISKLLKRERTTPYLVTFTSGTSGITKGVEHTLENLFSSALALNKEVKCPQNPVFLHVMPMTYMAGILNSLIYPFIIGAKIVITKRFSIIIARDFWKKVQKYHCSIFWLSPTMLMMIEQMDRGKIGEIYCHENDTVFLIGTAPLSNELRRKFNDRYDVKVYTSYGLSETLFVSVENDETLSKSLPNSVGKILNGVEYCFTEEKELYIAVPWMFIDYTNEDTNEYFDGKYYKTGDIAEIKNECLYITGRVKDLIVKGGMNLSPSLIESIICNDNRIQEVVVMGVKDKQGEEKICCVYTLNDDNIEIKHMEAQIKKNVLNELGKNYFLDYMWKVDVLPRNINGKIDKNVLKREWEKINV